MPRQTTKSVPDMSTLTGLDKGNKTKAELRQEALDGVLQIGQFGCLAFGQFADAGAIGMHGRPMTEELVKLAENNSKVASKVDLLIEIGPYAGIVAATIPFLAQLFVNHGLFKAEQFANAGVVSPETLEAQMKTEVMKQAMDAMLAQKQAEEEMVRMQDEMMSSVNGESQPDAE
jgi:hypothetical protein